MSEAWNEEDLRADIVSVWGEHGAHADVFDWMVKRISELERECEAWHHAYDLLAERRVDDIEELEAKLAAQKDLVRQYADYLSELRDAARAVVNSPYVRDAEAKTVNELGRLLESGHDDE